MITVKWQPKEYPTKSIIEDLMDRTGPAGYDDWTPFEGQRAEFDRQFSGFSRDIYSRIEFLSFTRNPDFNPQKRSNSALFLEDFSDSSDAAAYFSQFCVGYKIDPRKSYIKTKGIKYQAVFEDSETGASDTIASFEETIEEDLNLDSERLFDRLTYLVKLIWIACDKYKANLFSFAFAYYDMQNRKRGKINRHSFKEYSENGRLFRIMNDGSQIIFYHERDQKYTLYTNAMDIFVGRLDPLVYKQCMEFCSILKELGFDPVKEKPEEYTKEFCDSIPCLYVDTSMEFVKGNAFISQIKNAGGAMLPKGKFFPISVDTNSYIARLHEAKDLLMPVLESAHLDDKPEDEVTWQEVIDAFLIGLNVPERNRSLLIKKLSIRDNFVRTDTGDLLPISGSSAFWELDGCNDYMIYVLDNGDLLTMVINTATYETHTYYSLSRKGNLGYDGIRWSQLN